MNVLIMGVAGSGKGTMSEKISENFGLKHISTGDMFRAAIKSQSELGLEAKKFIDKGLLVPDELTIAMVKDRLSQDDCKKGYLLDGFPRTLPQAEALEEIAVEIGKPINCVLNLVMPFDTLAERITGRRTCPKCRAIYHIKFSPSKVEGICDECQTPLVHRADDSVEQLKVRIKEHEKNTRPALEFYGRMGLVKDINAAQSIEEVWHDIKSVLESVE